MFKTRVTEMLGIQYPIIGAPMASLSYAELVSAVSNAGGLGILVGTTHPSPQSLREEIKKTRSLTDKPFGVNVTLAPGRPIKYEDYFAVAIEEGVKVIETSARSPEPYMKLLKDAKVTVMHRATRTRDVKTAERVGADIATIVGIEAAGNPGQEDVGSFVRIPAAVDAVKIPIVAAGGIADARGFVAALAMGAEAVLMGTRFMASKECPAHPKLKEWLLGLGETDTILIQRSIVSTSRVVKTDYTQKILEAELKGATPEELRALASDQRQEHSYVTGDISNANIPIGQAVGLVHDLPSVKEIIEGIVSEAKVIMQRLNNLGLAG
ncbi:MAG: nitronate monooxygenase [Chloroflexi bacterium]|nr:nitronate monooxygenase [Chloroflexota bacterium]